MVLDRGDGDEKRGSDLRIAESGSNERRHLVLAPRKGVETRVRSRRDERYGFIAIAIDGNLDRLPREFDEFRHGQLSRPLAHGIEQSANLAARVVINHGNTLEHNGREESM